MKFWSCLIFILINPFVFSQIVVEVPLRGFFKPEPIKKNKIQSLVVFVDFYGDEADSRIQRNGKILECEFDSSGYMRYKVSVGRPKKYPFLDYPGNHLVEYLQFDNRGELVYLHRENTDEIYQLSRKYTTQGNLMQSTIIVDDKVMSNHQFTWRDGEMLEYSDTVKKAEGDDSEFIFDNQARVIQIKGDPIQVYFEYKQIGDTIKVTETTFESGIRIITETYSYLQNFKEHYTQYTSTNTEGDLDIEMRVSCDDFGNAVTYYLFDRNGNPYDLERSSLKKYRIENQYDEDGLLTSRKFYSTKKDLKEEELIRLERYIYDTEPLIIRFEKGEILENYGNY